MQDRPTAQELLKAARDLCERDLLPALTGRVQFHTRVLVNVLAILEREWEQEEPGVRAEYVRLQQLLELDEVQGEVPAPRHSAEPSFAEIRERVRTANTELAEKIRSGEMDDRFDDVLAALEATTNDKLAIANPNWF